MEDGWNELACGESRRTSRTDGRIRESLVGQRRHCSKRGCDEEELRHETLRAGVLLAVFFRGLRDVSSRTSHPRREAHRNSRQRGSVPSCPARPWRSPAPRCWAERNPRSRRPNGTLRVPEPAARTLHGDRRRCPGFKTIVRENIEVVGRRDGHADFSLPVGAVSETVTVSAEAPLVDAKTATIDSRIDKELLAKLPTSRDAFYDLALTAPGMFDSSSSQLAAEPDGLRQRDQRERVPDQRRQRHQSRGRRVRHARQRQLRRRRGSARRRHWAPRPSTAASRARRSTS